MWDVSSQASMPSMPSMDALPEASMATMDATCEVSVLEINLYHYA
jgi:hypothetical protein